MKRNRCLKRQRRQGVRRFMKIREAQAVDKQKFKAALINLSLAAIILGMYFVLIFPYTHYTAASAFPIYKGNRKDRVALQCAVSWDAAALEPILDTLAEKNVKITFTVSGEWAQRNRSILKRMADEGHEIATMGFSPEKSGSLNFIKNDIKKSLDLIKEITGLSPELYYCGTRNTKKAARAAESLGLKCVMCTVDLVCSKGSASDILQRISGNTNGGDIVLVSPTAAFSESLSDILDYFASAGLTASTISGTIYSRGVLGG